MDRFHRALKIEKIGTAKTADADFTIARAQHGRDDIVHGLHVWVRTFSPSSTLSMEGALKLLGFEKSQCTVGPGSECHVIQVPAGIDVQALATAIAAACDCLRRASGHLQACGLYQDRPGSGGGRVRSWRLRGASGEERHRGSESRLLASTEDQHFAFRLSWLVDNRWKGWVVHHRAKHSPIQPELASALAFLGLGVQNECPHFDFEGCQYRAIPYEEGDYSLTDRVHTYFQAHSTNFSPALQAIMEANEAMRPFGLDFLVIDEPGIALGGRARSPGGILLHLPPGGGPTVGGRTSSLPEKFDVAFSFASSERQHADQLARMVQNAGYKVFYDAFYLPDLWGKNLVDLFDHIYRKASRFCVMFVSREYGERMWTTHERQAAQARALREKGNDYILPIRVDATDLPGLNPNIAFLQLGEHSLEQIGSMLIERLGSR